MVRSPMEKEQSLREALTKMGSVVVAFSAGVDSTYLLKVAHDTLRDKAVAVTLRVSASPEEEVSEAIGFCEKEKIAHTIIDIDQLQIKGFAENPPDRCYLCKKVLFGKVLEYARSLGIPYVIDGSNADDTDDYRPGMRALKELHIVSPLHDAGMTKDDIRTASEALGLKTASKPSLACLATRFVYGETITKEKLERVFAAEKLLRDMGIRQVRVRVHGEHGDLARIEIGKDEMTSFLNKETMQTVQEKLLELGFLYVTLDLGGYETGSMNLSLKNPPNMN